jgi:hypothetical protein
MNRQEYLIVKLIEESAEVIQRATKILTFGKDEVQPEQEKDNSERLVAEFNDMLAVLEMVIESGVELRRIADPIALSKKKTRVEEFMKLSRAQGCLQDGI